jgi:hypothetical protein
MAKRKQGSSPEAASDCWFPVDGPVSGLPADGRGHIVHSLPWQDWPAIFALAKSARSYYVP